jgi:hypothetical protein
VAEWRDAPGGLGRPQGGLGKVDGHVAPRVVAATLVAPRDFSGW